ncbi:MAG: hypothetical protein WD058_09630 [Dehalococcoidia bacterium]
MSAEQIAERWGGLASQPESAQSEGMRSILAEVLALDDTHRLDVLEAMVRAEYALESDSLRAFTRSRLRTWIAISADDLEGAKSLARGYDAAFDRLPAELAMRRASTVQTVARSDLAADEVTALFDLIPSLVRQVPRATPAPISAARTADAVTSGVNAVVAAAARPWWKVWARS